MRTGGTPWHEVQRTEEVQAGATAAGCCPPAPTASQLDQHGETFTCAGRPRGGLPGRAGRGHLGPAGAVGGRASELPGWLRVPACHSGVGPCLSAPATLCMVTPSLGPRSRSCGMGATASQATHLPRSEPADGLAQGACCGRDDNPKGKGSWAGQRPQPPLRGQKDQQTRGPGLQRGPHLTQAANPRVSPEGGVRTPLAALAWRGKDLLGADTRDSVSQQAAPAPGSRQHTVSTPPCATREKPSEMLVSPSAWDTSKSQDRHCPRRAFRRLSKPPGSPYIPRGGTAATGTGPPSSTPQMSGGICPQAAGFWGQAGVLWTCEVQTQPAASSTST